RFTLNPSATMRLTYHGHSCFLLEAGPHRLLIDPFFDENPVAVKRAEEIACDFILVSHGHIDHCADALAISRAHQAPIIANFEISEFYAAQGARTHGLNPGGGAAFPFGRVTLTPARHSSSQGDPLNPIYLGEACGLVISAAGREVYHAGDTALFLDMQLIARRGLDLAMLPIGDNFTMGPDDALDALDLLKPRLSVPMHYNTWPPIRQDGGAFAQAAAARGHHVIALKPGEVLDVPVPVGS